jgi:hypothetical protein
MTIKEIHDYIKSIALSHKDIKTFKSGKAYNIGEDNKMQYPLCYLELPIFTTNDDEYQELTISLQIHLQSKLDNVDVDIYYVSIAKEINDDIINYINETSTDIRILSYTGLSLNEFGDDNIAGWRNEIIIKAIKPCKDSLKNFN